MIKIIITIASVLLLSSDLQAKTIPPRVFVIGAGVGGLTAARHLKKAGINFTVVEASNYVGGIWRYEERVGTDEYGKPIYTSMYKNLRTNLPKPLMEIPDFPLPENLLSFPGRESYYNYLQSYANHFDLKKHIKFLHTATSVKRVGNIWKVSYEHVPTGNVFEENYDYVIVASGHHSKPHMPNIAGEKLFKGTIIHSHDYRHPEPYKCRRVLIIGVGPSGMDISRDVAYVSKAIFHSHHSKIFNSTFPSRYTKKPDVKEFNETGVIFQDGTYEEIDDVIYCTGYEYNYPFLDETSGLTIKPSSVVPLYRYVVNIKQPTMMVLGAIVRACIVIATDVQARYATSIIKGNFTLPTQEEMMAEWQERYNALRSSGRPLSHIHILDDKEDQFYADVSKQAGILRVSPILSKIRAFVAIDRSENLYRYRKYSFKIIDDEKCLHTREYSKEGDYEPEYETCV